MKIGAFVALLLISAMVALPLLWMLSLSLQSEGAVHSDPPRILPDDVSFYHDAGGRTVPLPGNYGRVLDQFNFLLYARNSFFVAGMTVAGSVISSALVAYGFAKVPFRGSKALFALMLATMMIPFPVTMATLFLIFRWLTVHTGVAFLGTFRPLWLPAFFGSAFNIFLLRQFFVGIPEELSEAARLDGCSELGIFFRIIVPLSRPALAVVALFAFMNAWNDFLAPLVYLQDPRQYTLSLALQAFESQHGGTQENLLMAAATLTVVPVLLLFFLVQKTFIEGIATTGIKG